MTTGKDTHDGKWIAIQDEMVESFGLGKPFDTREEAEAFARGEDMHAVAQLKKFTSKRAAELMDADWLVEHMDEAAPDQEWCADDTLLAIPRDKLHAAETDLRELLAGWIERHDIIARQWYQAEETYTVRELEA